MQDRLDAWFPDGAVGTVITPGDESFPVHVPRLYVAEIRDGHALLWAMTLNFNDKDIYVDCVRMGWPSEGRLVILCPLPAGRHYQFERPTDERIRSELRAFRNAQFSAPVTWTFDE